MASRTSTNGNRGARDTEIWVTFLHHAAQQRVGVSYFASNDAGFGPAAHAALIAEAREKGANVRLLNSIDAIVDDLSSLADCPYAVEELAALPSVRDALAGYLQDGNIRYAIADWIPGVGSVNETRNNTFEPVEGMGKTAACRMGTVTIIGFEQIWRIQYGYRVGTYDGDEQRFEFTMKIGFVIQVEDGEVRAWPVNNAGVWEALPGPDPTDDAPVITEELAPGH